MKVNRKKLELAMARACFSTGELATAAQLPRPTLNNAIVGRNVKACTLGKIAKALGVDPADIIEEE